MSDRTWAQIKIGGNLPRSLLPELIKLLDEESLLPGYDDPQAYPPVKVPDDFDIMTCLATDNSRNLIFESSEALNGEYKELEDWLIKHNMSFAVDSSYDKEGTPTSSKSYFWTPNLEEPNIIINDSDQQHMIHVGEVEWILLAMKTVGSIEEAPKFLNHGNVHEKSFAAYILQENNYDPIGYLNKHLNEFYAVPDLPPFIIMEAL